jgi:hypothetical protein
VAEFVDHIERCLGPIQKGWSKYADGQRLSFQVILAGGGPITGAQLLLTLGLSDTPLRVGKTPRRLHQELMFMIRASDGPRNLPGLLQQVALEALTKDEAYGVGDVLGSRGELYAGSPLEALFVALPVYLPDSFHVFRAEGSDPIVIGWLVSVTASEAALAQSSSSSALEDQIVRFDTDLLDFERESIV